MLKISTLSKLSRQHIENALDSRYPGSATWWPRCGWQERRPVGTRTAPWLLAIILLAASGVHAQGGFTVVTGKEFDGAMPSEFYLEGHAIPTEKRNAALIRTSAGHRVLFALLDTSGYSSQVQQKYLGMMIVDGGISICGKRLQTGSYGFGLRAPAGQGMGLAPASESKFLVYSQDGVEQRACVVRPDPAMAHPRPLQVMAGDGSTGILLLGRYRLALE